MRAEIRSKRVLFASLALIVVLAALVGPALAAKPWEKFKFPELGEVNIPDYERALLVSNHSGQLPWDGAMIMMIVVNGRD